MSRGSYLVSRIVAESRARWRIRQVREARRRVDESEGLARSHVTISSPKQLDSIAGPR
ncbi:hypothetical protein MMSP_0626 [Mycobacterium sp. 012931]|nr:hypothetical protein MMSP_0626 [Mycobacterium sp. 012931]MBC9861259.1 hypothetical protein [Mycobacterium pseudoshottsii]